MKLLKFTFLLIFSFSILSCGEDSTTEATKNSMKATITEGIDSYQFSSTNIFGTDLNDDKKIVADSPVGQITLLYPKETAVNDTVSLDLQSLSTATYLDHANGDFLSSKDGYLVITKNDESFIEGSFSVTVFLDERSVEITNGKFTYEKK